jgi:hypothetical protein
MNLHNLSHPKCTILLVRTLKEEVTKSMNEEEKQEGNSRKNGKEETRKRRKMKAKNEGEKRKKFRQIKI